MTDYENLIRFEREHSALDLKAAVYSREQHPALLKDLIALANADVEGDRFIVLGVKESPDGTRQLLGVRPDSLPDAATYQQLLRENVEPDAEIELVSLELDGLTFAIIRIYNCSDRPYLLRKQYADLAKGDGWIRMGTHQPRLIRRDFDRIYAKRLANEGFTSQVRIRFDTPEEPSELALQSAGNILLPSEQAAQQIRAALWLRKQLGRSPIFDASLGGVLGPAPYHSRSPEELERNLGEVDETYAAEDRYARFEKYSHKLNFVLLNAGSNHLEDALLEVRIPKREGVFVADDVYPEPTYNHFGLPLYLPSPRGYPDVSEDSLGFVVRAGLGDLRHQVPTRAFDVPLRLTLIGEVDDPELPIQCTLYGRNLRQPIRQSLLIRIEPPSPVTEEEEEDEEGKSV